jgi:hypothetical protein
VFQLVLVRHRVPIRANGDRSGAGLEDDGMVAAPLGW